MRRLGQAKVTKRSYHQIDEGLHIDNRQSVCIWASGRGVYQKSLIRHIYSTYNLPLRKNADKIISLLRIGRKYYIFIRLIYFSVGTWAALSEAITF